MLPRRTFYILGGSFLFVAVFLLMQSFGGFTGYAVFDETNQTTNYFMITFWFLIAGLFILFLSRNAIKSKSQ